MSVTCQAAQLKYIVVSPEKECEICAGGKLQPMVSERYLCVRSKENPHRNSELELQ